MEVTLKRKVKAPDGAGGTTSTPVTLDPQRVRLISRDTVAGAQQRTTVDGKLVTPAYVLLAEYDADIKAGDSFRIDTADYEIVFVRLDKRYEVTAEVAYRG
jgi:hypothetical protein